MMNANK